MKAERIPDVSGLIPRRAEVQWSEEAGRVTVVRTRPGAIRRRVLRLFGVPPTLKVHLDALGSAAWRHIDGKRTAAQIKDALQTEFTDESNLAQRLGHFLGIMVSRGLVILDAPPSGST